MMERGEVMSFTIFGPPPRVDGKRAYKGYPQLTQRDYKILAQIRAQGGLACHQSNGTVFRLRDGTELPRKATSRLIRLRHVIVAEDALFSEMMGQSLLVNTAGIDDISNTNIGTDNITSATNETPASL